nr:DUF6153 family protein [Streptomyces sp. SID5910]
MAVLAGVLGMHGLAPGGMPAAHPSGGHVMTAAAHAGGACAHTGGGASHLDHADGTCSAAGIGSAYAPPALTGALLDARPVPAPGAALSGASHDGRAPPDLSELQLLRI